MAMIRIDGVDLPQPATYKVTLQDLDSENTTRSETGLLTRDRIRAGVYELEISWRVNREELQLITDALSPAKFSVTFFDPTSSSLKTADMYAGDRQGNLLFMHAGQSLWELSCSLMQY